MKEPVWVMREAVRLAHPQSLAQFGGLASVRDAGLLDSALGRPGNLCAHGQPSLFELTATYAFGPIKNHPFIDGNKRGGLVVALTFPEVNGWRLEATEVDATWRTLALAAGEMSEAADADGLKANSRRV